MKMRSSVRGLTRVVTAGRSRWTCHAGERGEASAIVTRGTSWRAGQPALAVTAVPSRARAETWTGGSFTGSGPRTGRQASLRQAAPRRSVTTASPDPWLTVRA